MKKIWKIFTVMLSFIGLASCGSSNSAIDNNPESQVTGESKVLVAYFSYSGNTQTVARTIRDELNSDIFRIVVSDPYTDETLYNRAQEEVNAKSFPALSSHIDADVFSDYDTFIVGFPIWWYDLPRPVATFISEYDFTNKTVIPFFTHNGSSSGASSLSTLGSMLTSANYRREDSLSIRGSSVDSSLSQIRNWAKGLNL